MLLLRHAALSMQTKVPSHSQEELATHERGSDASDVEAKTMVDEPLDFYVKATGKDGAQKRQELVNMRPGALRRCRERWQARRGNAALPRQEATYVGVGRA